MGHEFIFTNRSDFLFRGSLIEKMECIDSKIALLLPRIACFEIPMT